MQHPRFLLETQHTEVREVSCSAGCCRPWSRLWLPAPKVRQGCQHIGPTRVSYRAVRQQGMWVRSCNICHCLFRNQGTPTAARAQTFWSWWPSCMAQPHTPASLQLRLCRWHQGLQPRWQHQAAANPGLRLPPVLPRCCWGRGGIPITAAQQHPSLGQRRELLVRPPHRAKIPARAHRGARCPGTAAPTPLPSSTAALPACSTGWGCANSPGWSCLIAGACWRATATSMKANERVLIQIAFPLLVWSMSAHYSL